MQFYACLSKILWVTEANAFFKRNVISTLRLQKSRWSNHLSFVDICYSLTKKSTEPIKNMTYKWKMIWSSWFLRFKLVMIKLSLIFCHLVNKPIKKLSLLAMPRLKQWALFLTFGKDTKPISPLLLNFTTKKQTIHLWDAEKALNIGYRHSSKEVMRISL